MKKLVFILGVMVLLIGLLIPSAALADGPVTKVYGDVTLNNWGQGNFPENWDLTKCDLTLSYTIDMSGQTSGGWTPIQVGLREVGASNLDPHYLGGWMQQTWQYPATDPNKADLDDHFLLVDHGWASDELNYNVNSSGNIVTAFGSYLSYAFWFDRDGVDPSQATYWNYKDGITYNTSGIYDVEITYHYDSVSGFGTMFASINGEQQGFYLSGYDSANPPDTQPVGKTFTGDMTQMQVFYGRGSGGGAVNISAITVDGCLGMVVIDGCDTGVVDQICDGNTISGRIEECADNARNHGEFVSCVSAITNDLVSEGCLTGKEKGKIVSCAARADIPAP